MFMVKKRIAITGGIGSGKSTVMKIIEEQGYCTVSFDEVYHDLLSDENFVSDICALVGVRPLLIDGRKTLNRQAVSDKVFSDSALLDKLNAFTHEKITKAAFVKGDSFGAEIVFYEVPLLFESRLENLFDRVIVVMRNRDVRIAEAARRDGRSVDEVALRAEKQFDYENNDLSLHIVIENDGDLQSLKERVKKVLCEIR